METINKPEAIGNEIARFAQEARRRADAGDVAVVVGSEFMFNGGEPFGHEHGGEFKASDAGGRYSIEEGHLKQVVETIQKGLPKDCVVILPTALRLRDGTSTNSAVVLMPNGAIGRQLKREQNAFDGWRTDDMVRTAKQSSIFTVHDEEGLPPVKFSVYPCSDLYDAKVTDFNEVDLCVNPAYGSPVGTEAQRLTGVPIATVDGRDLPLGEKEPDRSPPLIESGLWRADASREWPAPVQKIMSQGKYIFDFGRVPIEQPNQNRSIGDPRTAREAYEQQRADGTLQHKAPAQSGTSSRNR